MEKWNKLCRALSEEISSDLLELPFEREIIYALDSILGWDRFDNVKNQVPVKMGVETKRADIVVTNDNDIKLFVIEAKRPNDFLVGHDKQLEGYMIHLRLNVGVLIGKKIQIYFDNGHKIILVDEIEFKRNSEKGLNFTTNFHKDNYSEENIQKYIQEKLKEKEEIKIVKKLKNELLSQSYVDKTIIFLKNELRKDFSENIINEVFETLKIKVEDTSKIKKEVYFLNNQSDYKIPKEDKKEGIAAYVRRTFLELVEENLIEIQEVENLQTPSYSKLHFGIDHSFLKKKPDSIPVKIPFYNKNTRIEIRGEFFWICSEWYEVPQNNDRPYYEKWLNKIKGQL
jgi:hypothetical protein